MHEIIPIENILNLIGIGFEITGFVLLLKNFRDWVYSKRKPEIIDKNIPFFENYYVPKKDKLVDKVMNILYKKSENLRKIFRDNVDKRYDYLGIPLVIIGLVFQGLSVVFHS